LPQARFHVLTYPPQPVLLEQRTYVKQLDSHSFSVAIVGQPYFSRLLGRFLIDGFRREGPFRAGGAFHTGAFDVRVAAADDEGVRELVFTFPNRLDDPRYCFYLTTIDCGAAHLRFSRNEPVTLTVQSRPDTGDVHTAIARLEKGDTSAAEPLFAAIQSETADAPAAKNAMRRVGG